MFLTPADLVQLTGYKSPAGQVRWLDARGWRYERDRAGRVIVSRAYAEAMMAGGQAPRVARGAPVWMSEPWIAEGKSPIKWLDDHWDEFSQSRTSVLMQSVPREREHELVTQGVYFLCHEGSVVYVGISEAIDWRLEQHRAAGKRFSSAWAFECPGMVAQQLEAFYYQAWRPALNIRAEQLDVALEHRLPK